nr:hypothetical protein [Janibacter hoylei]
MTAGLPPGTSRDEALGDLGAGEPGEGGVAPIAEVQDEPRGDEGGHPPGQQLASAGDEDAQAGRGPVPHERLEALGRLAEVARPARARHPTPAIDGEEEVWRGRRPAGAVVGAPPRVEGGVAARSQETTPVADVGLQALEEPADDRRILAVDHAADVVQAGQGGRRGRPVADDLDLEPVG